MRGRIAVVLIAAAVAGIAVSAELWDPTFLRWLNPEDPDDQTILFYWERFAAGEATPQELVDLGTLLAERDSPQGGYPKDAMRLFRLALDQDSELAEAWFRIGLMQHRQGELRSARKSYTRCLKRQEDHGWSLFYLGLVEEQLGRSRVAVEHYQRAFAAVPALADPAHNPELLYARMAASALIGHGLSSRTGEGGLMPFLEEDKVTALVESFLPEPELPPEPPTPPPARRVVEPEPEAVEAEEPAATPPPRPAPRPARTMPTPQAPAGTDTLERGGVRRNLTRPSWPAAGDGSPVAGGRLPTPAPEPTPVP